MKIESVALDPIHVLNKLCHSTPVHVDRHLFQTVKPLLRLSGFAAPKTVALWLIDAESLREPWQHRVDLHSIQITIEKLKNCVAFVAAADCSHCMVILGVKRSPAVENENLFRVYS